MSLPRLVLTRYWYEGERTLGELHCEGEFVAYTMEPGSDDTDAPRIPVGFYHMVRHEDPDGSKGFRYTDTWALEGRDISHDEHDDTKRTVVLFHKGNWDQDTRGCILLGMMIGRLGKGPAEETAVMASRDAMDRLRGFLGDGEAYLTVKGGK